MVAQWKSDFLGIANRPDSPYIYGTITEDVIPSRFSPDCVIWLPGYPIELLICIAVIGAPRAENPQSG